MQPLPGDGSARWQSVQRSSFPCRSCFLLQCRCAVSFCVGSTRGCVLLLWHLVIYGLCFGNNRTTRTKWLPSLSARSKRNMHRPCVCAQWCIALPVQVPVYGHINCGGCSTMLMYPVEAQSVKCSVCHFVSHVSSSSQSTAATSRPPYNRPRNQTVVVENPSTIDEQGNEVSNIAVGVKTDK